MEVYKFGGTSVGTAGRIKNVVDIIRNETKKMVVLSANSKSTDLLAEIIVHLKTSNTENALAVKVRLNLYYSQLINALFNDLRFRNEANTFLESLIDDIGKRFSQPISNQLEDWIISRGEVFSTMIFSLYLNERGIHHKLVAATDLIYLDNKKKPDQSKIKSRLTDIIQQHSETALFITQGFLCSDHEGKVTTLGRGGSDFTASLLAAGCSAGKVQIWSDVDGFLNNDPVFVRGALPLDYLSFDEAAELAYFGARVMHPASLHPAKEAGIPVVLKNTLNPAKPGTVISNRQQNGLIKAVASKDNICSITIHSHRMLMAYGFLRKVFEIFEKHQTPVDMVTTSEVSVSVTIDNTSQLEDILAELSELGQVAYQKDQSLVCVVGDSLSANKGKVEQVFAAVRKIPLRMISYGAAKNSISFLVDTTNKINTLEALNNLLSQSFQTQHHYV